MAVFFKARETGSNEIAIKRCGNYLGFFFGGYGALLVSIEHFSDL